MTAERRKEMDEKAHEINRIIYWLRQVKQIEGLENAFSNYSVKGSLIFKTGFKFAFWNTWGRRAEYELTDEEICLFLEFIREQKKHLQELIDKTDKEKLQIAQLVLNGEITSKGLTF